MGDYSKYPPSEGDYETARTAMRSSRREFGLPDTPEINAFIERQIEVKAHQLAYIRFLESFIHPRRQHEVGKG